MGKMPTYDSLKNPLPKALRSLGGSGSIDEIYEKVPATNTSVNPARSTRVALFVGDWAISQFWLFWVAPIIGGILGAVVYRFIGSEKD